MTQETVTRDLADVPDDHVLSVTAGNLKELKAQWRANASPPPRATASTTPIDVAGLVKMITEAHVAIAAALPSLTRAEMDALYTLGRQLTDLPYYGMYPERRKEEQG